MNEQHQKLSDDERIERVRLARTENVGPIGFRQLMERFGTASAALSALPTLARRGGRRAPIRICPRELAERELESAAALSAHPLTLGEAAYPVRLAAIADAPPIIYVRGEPDMLARPSVAIVGARNASAAGVRFARELAGGLGAAGLVVTSGFARGIDTAAHRGAVDTGTVAVLAGGVDNIFPPENQDLYDAIVSQGAVVSEMPPGTVPKARHFPRRNRLVAGLAFGIVVVEAAFRSGSLITARLALEQGREVFAVPGSPLDPRCRGSNGLIRQGAVLTETADDVLAVVSPMLTGYRAEPDDRPAMAPEEALTEATELDSSRAHIAAILSPTPVAVDELIRQSKLTASVVLTILLELELAGKLARHPGNRVSTP